MIDNRLYFFCLGMRSSALCSLHDYLWQKADLHTVNISDPITVTARQEYQKTQVTLYNDASNKIMKLRPKIVKSARIAQQLAENITPNRFEDIATKREYFNTDHYEHLTTEIRETEELTKEQFQRFSTQLMMLLILVNGHRAQIGALFKRKDLYTMKRHSLLNDRFIMELDK